MKIRQVSSDRVRMATVDFGEVVQLGDGRVVLILDGESVSTKETDAALVADLATGVLEWVNIVQRVKWLPGARVVV